MRRLFFTVLSTSLVASTAGALTGGVWGQLLTLAYAVPTPAGKSFENGKRACVRVRVAYVLRTDLAFLFLVYTHQLYFY